MTDGLNVVVWNENIHDRRDAKVKEIYPKGIHGTIADFLSEDKRLTVSTATMDQDQHGLSDAKLDACDVLIWWGHIGHDQVEDFIIDRVQERVLAGMGLIVLHSAHMSKIFKRLMGTTGYLSWREDGEREKIWVVDPSHAIAHGIGSSFELQEEEMYGEYFDIPRPDELVFISSFAGGEVFRSGCCWQRGHGKIFYFRPGHETFPSYHDLNVQLVIKNAVWWSKPRLRQTEQLRQQARQPH